MGIQKTISVLIPAFNEAESISEVVSSVHLTLNLIRTKNQLLDFEIVILNDGSTDRTPELVSSLASRYPEIKSFSNPKAVGLQRAFQQLYGMASMEWSCVFPGDGQWPTSSLINALNALETSNYESLILTKRTNRAEVYTKFRQIVSFTFNRLASFVLGTRVGDIGSIKVIPTKIANRNMSLHSPLQEIERLLIAIKMHKYTVIEVPVRFKERVGGVETGVSLSNLTRVFIEIAHCVYLKYKKNL